MTNETDDNAVMEALYPEEGTIGYLLRPKQAVIDYIYSLNKLRDERLYENILDLVTLYYPYSDMVCGELMDREAFWKMQTF